MILELAVFVQDVSDAAGHARGKIAPRFADDHDPSPGHVLAPVVAHTLDDCPHSAVAHREPLAGHAANISLAAGCAVKCDVADDDVFLGSKRRTLGRVENHFAAGKSFAKIVVGISFQLQRHTRRYERAEALAGRSLEVKMNCVLGKALRAKSPSDLAAQYRAHDPVSVANV